MEDKKPAQSSRFLDPSASGTPRAAAPRAARKPSEAPRRPSGFSAANSASQRRAAPKKQPPAAEKQPDRPSKPKAKLEKTHASKPRRGLKALLVCLIALLLALGLILIFGDRGVYHQMPIIEWENEASFAPEETPMPNMEGL